MMGKQRGDGASISLFTVTFSFFLMSKELHTCQELKTVDVSKQVLGHLLAWLPLLDAPQPVLAKHSLT